MSTEDICRTCLNKRGSELVGDNFQSIFSRLEEEDVYIADCLAQWIGRKIDENDGMPSNVCQPCLEAIKSIALFIENAKECDEKIRNWLDSDKSQIDFLTYVDRESEDDVDIKVEPDIQSTGAVSEGVSDEEQQIKQEDANASYSTSDNDDDAVDNDYEQDEDDDEDYEQEEEEEEEDNDDDDDEDYEETPKRRKNTSSLTTKSRRKRRKLTDELDDKEKEMYNVIEVKDKFLCCGCYLLFDTEADLTQHGKTVHEVAKRKNNAINRGKNIVCKCCYKRFSHVKQRQAHRKKYESIEKVFECKTCDRRIVSPDSRYNHAHNHPKWNVATPKLYQVPMSRLEKYGYLCCIRNCTSSHSSEDSLLEHIKNDHNLYKDDEAPSQSGDIQCPFCLRFYKSKEKLVAHYIHRYSVVSYQRDYQCHECGKIYSSQALLRSHANKHANVKPYECQVCHKRYYSDAVLKQHMMNHTHPKALECTICGMAFRRKMFLMNHYRVHSDDKPFECEVCNKTFRHSSTLFTHKKIHFPNSQYKCSECGKGFTDTGNLKRHLVSHTGIKPYQCNYCDKRFMRLTERSEHESFAHLGIMPYSCDICGKEFSVKRTFQKHQQTCGY